MNDDRDNPATIDDAQRDEPVGWTASFLPLKVGEGATGPMIPIYVATLGASALLIGLMEFLFSLGMMLGSFAWGRASDELGKRNAFIVGGFAWTALAFFLMFIASGVLLAVVARAGMGLAMAAYVAVGGALIADRSRPSNIASRIGGLNLIGGAGYSLGLVIGLVYLANGSIRSVFLLAAAAGLVSAVAALFWIHEPDRILRRREVNRLFRHVTVPFVMPFQRRTYAPLFVWYRPRWSELERRAYAYLAAILLAFLATGGVVVLLPVYLARLGASTPTIFAVFLVHALVSTAMYVPAGILADRIGYRKVQLAAIAVRSITFLLLALPWFASTVHVGAALALVGVTFAVLMTTGPAALMRAMPIRRSGELNGLFNLAAGMGMAGGALMAGVIVELSNFATLFLAAGVLTAIALVMTATAVYPRTQPQH